MKVKQQLGMLIPGCVFVLLVSVEMSCPGVIGLIAKGLRKVSRLCPKY